MKEKLSPLPILELGRYRHFRSAEMIYDVIAVARHSETLEPLVIYKALYGEGEIWVRPYEMFVGNVEHEGKVVKRFVKI
jgi:hypothetical protein